MQNVIATLALLASSALAASVGSAVVTNACDYDVYLYNTPAADGGYTAIDEVLSPNGSYSQTWTELTNGDGWSIKLSQSTSLTEIMQYEYTFQDDGIIWYDLSDVNGNPWNGNWEITATSATSTCDPKQQAYRYATDDAYGMQACPQDAVITVTLCSADESDDSSASSLSASVAAASSTASVESYSSSSVATSYSYDTATASASTTSSVEASSTAEASSSSAEASSSSAVTTTFATSTTQSSSVTTTDAAGSTVTDVETAVVTDVVTTTSWHHWQRNEHVHAHAHRHV